MQVSPSAAVAAQRPQQRFCRAPRGAAPGSRRPRSPWAARLLMRGDGFPSILSRALRVLNRCLQTLEGCLNTGGKCFSPPWNLGDLPLRTRLGMRLSIQQPQIGVAAKPFILSHTYSLTSTLVGVDTHGLTPVALAEEVCIYLDMRSPRICGVYCR